MPTLHWLNDEEGRKAVQTVPYRLLEEDPTISYGDLQAQNLLIHGDNLAALKSLLPYYAGQVKCIYIDPPYNTGSAFEHYDDNLEHSTWLNLIYPRLELLRDFLSEEGSIWVSVDDSEAHYMKVLLDEIFGRSKFIASNVWQKRYSRENREAIGDVHEYILTYAINPQIFKEQRNRIPLTAQQAKIYRNPNNDPNGPWRPIPMTAQGFRPNQMYPITTPTGAVHYPPEGRCWSTIEPEYKKLLEAGLIYFGKDGKSQPNTIRYLKDVEGFVPWTWWQSDEVGHTDEAKKEMQVLFGKDNVFDTPKPERLIERVLNIATNPGDLVLDSFLGSGTTAAVAHKMGRRYIGIELGEHAITHSMPRLRKVVDGEQGGISETVNWQGGGGFHFYRLGEPIFDENQNINPKISFGALAAHIWFSETHQPYKSPNEPCELLGVHNGVAYYLIYNGVLGDRRPVGGNALTSRLLRILPPHEGPKVIYSEVCYLQAPQLREANIEFKKIPNQIEAR